MKNKKIICIFIGVFLLFAAVFLGYVNVTYNKLNNIVDLLNANSLYSDIKIYYCDSSGSYINILSQENKSKIVDLFYNLKVKRKWIGQSDLIGGYSIEFLDGDNRIKIVESSKDFITVNGTKYSFDNKDLYSKISEIFVSEKEIQNLVSNEDGIINKTNLKVYLNDESNLYKEFGYDDTQEIYYYLTTGYETDIQIDSNSKKYILNFTQGNINSSFELYINDSYVVSVSKENGIKKVINTSIYSNRFRNMLLEDLRFDGNVVEIDMRKKNSLPDLYIKDKKLVSSITTWAYRISYNMTNILNFQRILSEEFLKEDNGIDVAVDEEIKISTNSKNVLPCDTYVSVRNITLNEKINVIRKSDGNYYINAPKIKGEYIIDFDVNFTLHQKSGTYSFKLNVK